MISVASCNINNTDGSYFNHTETTTNDSSYGSFNVSDDNDLCSTHNSNGLPVSDDIDIDQHSRCPSPSRHSSPSIATPNNLRNRRRSFTAEDVESQNPVQPLKLLQSMSSAFASTKVSIFVIIHFVSLF